VDQDAYARLAPIYDRVVADTSEDLAARAVAQLRFAGLPLGASVLDLGCGTGVSTVALAHAGFVPRGIDLSPAMLEEARARAAAANLELEFERGGVGDFRAEPKADAAICMHDVLNHVPPDEVPTALAHVHDALKPGAPLVLDVNLTPGGRALSGTCFNFDLGDTWVGFVVETRDREMVQRATLFHRDGARWDREDVVLRHHLFAPEEIQGLLTGAGFTVVESQPIDLVGAWVLKELVVCRA
jgi:SAM-dependent methyltransferase